MREHDVHCMYRCNFYAWQTVPLGKIKSINNHSETIFCLCFSYPPPLITNTILSLCLSPRTILGLGPHFGFLPATERGFIGDCTALFLEIYLDPSFGFPLKVGMIWSVDHLPLLSGHLRVRNFTLPLANAIWSVDPISNTLVRFGDLHFGSVRAWMISSVGPFAKTSVQFGGSAVRLLHP